MKLVDLLELIECLEYGTRIHISVVFLNDFGNNKTQLPFEKVIHSKPYCTYMKSFEGGYNKCYACRNAALKKAIKHKTPFGGKCINGVYEYVHPVVIGGNAVAVVFAGNILTDDINVLRETLETVIDIDRLEKFCEIIDAHIKLLDREYSNIESGFDARMTNLVNFIQDSLCDDLSVSRIASIFGYSEKYIG